MCLHSFAGSVSRATKTSLQFDCSTAFNTLADFKYASRYQFALHPHTMQSCHARVLPTVFLSFECRSYAPGANWTYLCPPGCAAFASTAPIFGCSAQNLYDISSSVCVAALHQVRRQDSEAATDCTRLYSIKVCVFLLCLLRDTLQAQPVD
jgi:hypothetical protein